MSIIALNCRIIVISREYRVFYSIPHHPNGVDASEKEATVERSPRLCWDIAIRNIRKGAILASTNARSID
jgi:hypothetical protein